MAKDLHTVLYLFYKANMIRSEFVLLIHKNTPYYFLRSRKAIKRDGAESTRIDVGGLDFRQAR